MFGYFVDLFVCDLGLMCSRLLASVFFGYYATPQTCCIITEHAWGFALAIEETWKNELLSISPETENDGSRANLAINRSRGCVNKALVAHDNCYALIC